MSGKIVCLCVAACIAAGLSGCSPDPPQYPEDGEYRAGMKDSLGVPPTEIPMADVRIDSLEAAFEAVNHPDLRIRWHAVMYIREESSTPFDDLSRLLSNSHDDVICAAINGIQATGPEEEVLKILMKTLDSPVLTIKTESVINLGKLGPVAAPAVPAIEAAMQIGDPRLAEKAGIALEQIAQK